jgi:anti-sigma regulatory factor (Ser/Thr protein kinase)
VARPSREERVSADGVVSAVRVPAELRSLAFVRCALAALLERASWPVGDAGRILLASGEAVINAVEHGSRANGLVEVEMVVVGSEARIAVRDEGVPGVPLPRMPEGPPPPSSSPRGRGLIIMRSSADTVAIRRRGEGTEVALLFARDTTARARTGEAAGGAGRQAA